MKFFGQWDCSFDYKKRLSIPRRWREELRAEKEVIITLGFEGYLRVYSRKEAKKFPPSQIWEVRIDKWGRILIPKKLIESASLNSLERKATWFGEGNYLELRPR